MVFKVHLVGWWISVLTTIIGRGIRGIADSRDALSEFLLGVSVAFGLSRVSSRAGLGARGLEKVGTNLDWL